MDKISRELYKHNDDYYNRYDTYQKIRRNSEYERPASAQPIAVLQAEGKKKKFGRK